MPRHVWRCCVVEALRAEDALDRPEREERAERRDAMLVASLSRRFTVGKDFALGWIGAGWG